MKIGPFSIEQCNQKIGEWLTPILPVQTQTPDTEITFHVKEAGAMVTWAVEFRQTLSDFARMIIGGPLPKPKKIDQMLIIGDEILPNGLWILYSVLDQKMLKLKFETEVEALAYRNHYNKKYEGTDGSIPQFEPEKISKAMSVDPWWDGGFRIPNYYGFRRVLKKKESICR